MWSPRAPRHTPRTREAVTLYRILLADDDEDNRQALVECVTSEPGLSTLEAKDGTEALALARAARPDIMVLDQRMPGLTGAGVVEALRADGSEIPAILISAAKDVGAIASRHAVIACLAKPFGCEELLELIREQAPKGGDVGK